MEQKTATGQRLEGRRPLEKTLLAVKDAFQSAKIRRHCHRHQKTPVWEMA